MSEAIPHLSGRHKLFLSAALGAAGALLFAFSLAAILRLEQGTLEGRLVLALLFASEVMLAVALLRREGCAASTLLALLLPLGAAFLVRALCLDYVTLDFQDFLSPWVEFFREHGGPLGLGEAVGNYNVPYLYFLSLISLLPLPELYLIKLFSILFDILLAWGAMRVVRVFRPQTYLPELAFTVSLLLPTVLLNGALWAQCDSIYGALMLLSTASILEGHPRRSVCLAALAFSFKLQAIFFLPVFALYWMVKRVNLRQLLLFPLTYLITCLPALALGRPLGDILGIYLRQTGEGANTLNFNAPSLFSLIGSNDQAAVWSVIGIFLAAVITLGTLALCWLRRDLLNDRTLVSFTLFFCLAIPFFLPHMHERYFFLADVMAVTVACFGGARRVYLPALIQLASLGGYHAYLMKRYLLPVLWSPMAWCGLLNLAALLLLAWELAIRLRLPLPNPEELLTAARQRHVRANAPSKEPSPAAHSPRRGQHSGSRRPRR